MMIDKKEPLEEKVATREHIVTDQGNGGYYRSNCQYNLGSDPSRKYETCPGGDYKLIEGKIWINEGGQDFI